MDIVALRGAATLKSRATKDVWNAAEKGMGGASSSGEGSSRGSLINNIIVNQKLSGDQLQPCDSKLDIIQPVCYRGLLANGCELLKRTRNGNFLLKIVRSESPIY